MNWSSAFKKSGRTKQKRDFEAYKIKSLNEWTNKKPQEIVEEEVNKKLAVVSKIADAGIDEKNQLKAAISWLRFSRQLSEVKKLEIEGSLTLESRLNEVLEKIEKENEDHKI